MVSGRVAAIQAAFEDEVRVFFNRVADLADAAALQIPFWSIESAFSRSLFADDAQADAPIRLVWIARLGKLTSHGLMGVAQMAAALGQRGSFSDAATAFGVPTTGKLAAAALAGCIIEELSDRADLTGGARHVSTGDRIEIQRLLASIPNDSAAVLDMLGQFDLIRRQAAIAIGAATATEKIALGLVASGVERQDA